MSQTKVQLIAPIGVVTATTLETTGVLTATTFVGDIAGTVTGITSTTDNLNLGIVTATSFAGDFTGIGSGLTGTPNIVAGIVTATKFVGNTPGTVSGLADGTNINAGIITATSFVGNLTGNAAGLSTTTAQLTLGIVTATSYSGSGANLDGVSSGPVAQQAVTANSSTTTIDLSSGNLIYMTQSANTTVAFANTEGNTDVVYLVRVKDATSTERTITWPSGMIWNGGSEPDITNVNDENEAQIFKLTTRDNGATWYGVETFKLEPAYLWSIGYNQNGRLGLSQSEPVSISSPVQISAKWSSNPGIGASVNKSLTGEHNVNMVKGDGTLWGWGANGYGDLAQNNVTYYSSPVQIPGTTWQTLMIGGGNARGKASIKTDGTMWVWGRNHQGQLGQSNTTSYSSPVQVPGTTWKACFQGGTVGAGTKTDGTLWTWGDNQRGQLGLNNKTEYSSPKQIPGTTWDAIVGGWDENMFAFRTDGTLWAWGYNANGQLGQNNRTDYSSPVQIPGTTWAKLNHAAGFQANLAIKTDGTLWSWGYNSHGQSGLNTGGEPVRLSSPVQVPGTTWDDVSAYGYSTYGHKTDGTLWGWGSNYYGQLGQNQGGSGTKRSSPAQIPGTWEQAVVGNNVGYFWKR